MHREKLWYFCARYIILSSVMEEMIFPAELREDFDFLRIFLKIYQKSLDNPGYWKYNCLVMQKEFPLVYRANQPH